MTQPTKKKKKKKKKVEGRMLILRVVWGSTQLIALGALAYLYTLIAATKNTPNGKRELRVPRKPTISEPRPNGSDTMTVHEYDVAQLKEAVTGALVQTVLMLLVHIYWDATVPLVTTSITSLQRLVDNKLIRIYVFGSSGADLERPFKADENPFAALLGQQQPDAAAPAQQQQQQQQQAANVKAVGGKPGSGKPAGAPTVASKKLN
jgi:hypothetical protein